MSHRGVDKTLVTILKVVVPSSTLWKKNDFVFEILLWIQIFVKYGENTNRIFKNKKLNGYVDLDQNKI